MGDLEGGVQGRGLCDREGAFYACITMNSKISKKSIRRRHDERTISRQIVLKGDGA